MELPSWKASTCVSKASVSFENICLELPSGQRILEGTRDSLDASGGGLEDWMTF